MCKLSHNAFNAVINIDNGLSDSHLGCVLAGTWSYFGHPVMRFGAPVGDLLNVRLDQTKMADIVNKRF